MVLDAGAEARDRRRERWSGPDAPQVARKYAIRFGELYTWHRELVRVQPFNSLQLFNRNRSSILPEDFRNGLLYMPSICKRHTQTREPSMHSVTPAQCNRSELGYDSSRDPDRGGMFRMVAK